jgi:polyhydroxyalkanoate synthesis repressor PhaR
MNEIQPLKQPTHEPKIIKRYSNRKLYDTEESRYVTLDEIGEMVKQGVEVKIIDNRSKDDLTSVTLAQIIFEEEKKKSQMPLSLLRDIIRAPTQSISGFVASMKEGAESRLDSAAEFFKAPQRTWDEWQRKLDERIRTVVENVLGNLPTMGRDMHTLSTRIEELEKKLSEVETQKKVN